MQCPPIDPRSREPVENALENQVLRFHTDFAGTMEMYGDRETVARYLDAHEGWFCRCAEPMKTIPFGENGYVMTIGRYGAFGYEVEPRMAVVLDPPVDGVYYTRSVPIPDEPFLGYWVDYEAVMRLQEISADEIREEVHLIFQEHGREIPNAITSVTWELHMDVAVKFPKFIYKISRSILQKTGDSLLARIVRQVSPRLTYKVQQDFHTGHDLPFPPDSGRRLDRIDRPAD
ncbi:DUF1997 domain-containing protein [Pannus brasiliensis CCIBt3594]|uniref:DUF1997 domain-containing protein n=1 Tax=Pannus brasiliensis CCIBt3594 TaxID=1427578 RepID=A0AAW9QLN7_9CHRO